MLGLSSEKLSLDASSWSIGEATFSKLVETIRAIRQPSRIVEFGSGPSSVRLALAFPGAEILALESDEQCYQETKSLQAECLADGRLEVRYKPLKFQRYGSGQILSYDVDYFFGDEKVDCVIVDGPPFYTLRGREACLYQIYSKLDVGGVVFLDDYSRADEKTILNNWLSVYPDGFSVDIVEVGHQVALLQKLRTVEPHWDNQPRLNDSLQINELYAKIRAALLHLDDAALLRFNVTDKRLVQTIRDAYEATDEQIQSVAIQDAKLMPGQQTRVQLLSLKIIGQKLFGMDLLAGLTGGNLINAESR